MLRTVFAMRDDHAEVVRRFSKNHKIPPEELIDSILADWISVTVAAHQEPMPANVLIFSRVKKSS